MAVPANPRTGDREDDLWMQPASGVLDPEDDITMFTHPYTMQADNVSWNPEDYINWSNDVPANISMIQPACERDGTAQSSSNHINTLAANGSDSGGYVNKTPRGGGAEEQMQALFTTTFPTDSDIEPQYLPGNTILAEKDQEEPEYITYARTPHVAKRARGNSGPSSQEWQKWKREIYNLYVSNTLEVTREEMAKKGFHAGESMYKRRFKEWGWRKYELDKDSGHSGGEPSTGKLGKRTRGKALSPLSTLREDTFQSNNSRSSTVLAFTPPHLVQTHSQPTHSSSTLSNSTLSSSVHSNFTHFTPSHLYPTRFTSIQFNPSALREETSQSHSLSGPPVADFTPPQLPTHIKLTRSSMGIPAPISDTEFDVLLSTILNNVKDLYISYPAQNKWKVQKQREVEEDIHDELLVGVATSLRNSSSLSLEVGDKGFQKALQTVGKVVGIGDAADCGLFSLPAIWVSFLCMIRHQRPDRASEFLSLAWGLAVHKFGGKHQFVQVLHNLQKIWMKDPDQLEEVVFTAYRRCIADVKEQLGPFNLTYLSLWGDFVVYLDGRSTNETQAAVKDIRSVIKISEEEKGPGGGPDGDYTLELLGLTLYVLQSAPTMADEAEEVAKELLIRLNQRRVKAGGQLVGNLFVTWKDLRQTLGTFCLDKKDYHQAISYLEDFLSHEIVDDRDALALEKLERCYLALGRDDDAKKVWQWRMDNSERLLQKTETEQIEGEKVADGHEETDDEDSRDVSEEEGSSEATVINQVEESNEENLEEGIGDEFGDAEVEIQLLQEQIAGLKQRVKVLKQARRNGGRM